MFFADPGLNLALSALVYLCPETARPSTGRAAEAIEMAEKTVPWWRKALNYALQGIRSGFGLFSRRAETEPQAEGKVFVREANLEEEETALTNQSPIPETIVTEPVKLVEPTSAPEAAIASTSIADPVPMPIAEDEDEVGVDETILPIASESSVPMTTPEPIFTVETVIAMGSVPIGEPEAPVTPGPGIDPDPDPKSPPAKDPDPEPPSPSVEPDPDPDDAPSPVRASDFDPEQEIAVSPIAQAETVTGQVPALEQSPELDAAPEIEQETQPSIDQGTEPTMDQMDQQTEPDSLHAPIPAFEPDPAPVIDPVDPAATATEQQADAILETEPAPVPAPQPATDPVLPTAELSEAAAAPPITAAPPPSPVNQPDEPPAAAAQPDPTSEVAPAPETAPQLVLTSKPPIKVQSRDDNSDLSPFSVIVDQVYDGPLDLLLDLIRKQDIDIYDIPIAKITAQFLAYVNQLKAGDMDVAGDFIYIASLLIHIKSKMLLPRAPSGPDEQAEDPRRELVERLLEHERFKNAAQMLQQKQMLEAATWTNPGLREFKDDAAAEPEIAADTVDLVRIFRDILERARTRPVFSIDEDSVTVGQMIQFLARRLTMEDKPVALHRLLSHTRSERALIAIFLALLELVRLQAVILRQDLAFSEIFIKKHTGFDAVMNEGLANARDDWR
jgi:segregation and condensation protein A